MDDTDRLDRRTFVSRIGTAAGVIAIAGCAGTDDDGDDEDEDVDVAPDFVDVEEPPDAVYVPTHREAMRMIEPVAAGDVVIAPMLSYPHPFWIVAGDDEASIERVEPDGGRGVHMMFTLWDRETGIVLPVDDGAELRVRRDGEQIGSPLSPWTMISQGMGFHFGDNVSLPDDDTYTVEIELPPLSTRTTGDLAGRFEEAETATFEFEYDEAFRSEVIGGIEYFDEEIWGTRGAIEPMDHGSHDGEDSHDGDHDDHGSHAGEDSHDDDHDDHGDHEDGHDDGADHGDHEDGHDDGTDHGDHGHHGVPYSALPAIDAYPGTILVDPADGTVPMETDDLPTSGDARILATVLDADHRLSEEGPYLLVSPRTPYNRVPLADASLSVTIERDGAVVTETSLEQTLDGEYDLHYGTSVPSRSIEPGDTVTIAFESPPQVARHQGYETAFLEMEPIELEVPES